MNVKSALRIFEESGPAVRRSPGHNTGPVNAWQFLAGYMTDQERKDFHDAWDRAGNDGKTGFLILLTAFRERLISEGIL